MREKKNHRGKVKEVEKLQYVGPKGAALISFILNNKKDFHYLSFTSQWPNNFERF
jgi:hypothetical protein